MTHIRPRQAAEPCWRLAQRLLLQALRVWGGVTRGAWGQGFPLHHQSCFHCLPGRGGGGRRLIRTHSVRVLLVAASDVTAQHSGVEGGCLASAAGWRGHVVDALRA